MTDISPDAPVMVTGANGFVASWLTRALLADGKTVHAAVRDPENKEKVGPLIELGATLPGTLKLFSADLLIPGSYDEAAAGCELIFHTASPFTMRVKNPQTELVDPAVQGTQNVLDTANRTETLRRVVLTSSCAAIYGDNIDCAEKPGGTLTEAHWNTSSSLAHNPYQYSKARAERAAWDMAERQDRWDLVVVNPSLVIGPPINPNATSESFSIVKQLGDGSMKPGAPDLGMGVIDVRDLAQAHVKAGYTPGASGRHIVNAWNTTLLEMADALRPTYDQYPLPRRHLPKWLLWLLGPSQGLSRTFVSRNVGHAFKADNSKAVQSLGLEFRPLEASMQDMFAQMIQSGRLRAR
ncbi:NAD-dependent epimerase/dehydratase family protein [Abyssibacter profundi]|uniref:Diaminohydroxyphosphoribosylaminopyrimidine deaminase n=1 Tax=Abyssibacter profundi TaxID=2182787 RepID=A0A363UPR9_9GAMM|nr:NAD-dependent epimerase/dehydratase family protein [Abyssibacter profundi]MBV62582.1 diaminohydroxyphosphoribosylaminopyrimidine deaminase [Nevskiales bacterium]PWN57478.1 diaminohydroxyphosphoribosylaminopyrimidine deaminase [Abyssibacter profundi]